VTLEQEVLHYRNMVKTYRFDYLTGMKQRHDFEHESLRKFIDKEFYLTMYDVVGLHSVNKDHGYAAGDALIRQVANDVKLTECLWDTYRIGGDEFMALHFERPIGNVENATSATVCSKDFKSFSEMISSVDLLVIEAKTALKRRRAD